MKQPKYKIGDEVWVILGVNVDSRLVMGVFCSHVEGKGEEIKYAINVKDEPYKINDWWLALWIEEKLLFPTKEALIKSL